MTSLAKYSKAFLILIILMVGSVVCIHAQNVDPVTQALGEAQKKAQENDKKLEELRKELAKSIREFTKLQDTSTKLNSSITNYRANIDSLKNQRNASEQSINDSISAVKQRILDLQSQLDGLKASAQGSIANGSASLRDSLLLLEQEIQGIRQNLELANIEVSRLGGFKKSFIDNLAQSPDKWKSTRLSDIKLSALENDIAECLKYSEEDKRLATAYRNLMDIQGRVIIYGNAVAIYNAPYNQRALQNALSSVDNAIGSCNIPIHEQELQAIAESLNKYDLAAKEFAKILQKVESDLNKRDIGDDKHKYAVSYIDKTILDGKYETMIQIREIPWLDKKLTEYLDELNKDCLKAGGVRESLVRLFLSDNEQH